MVTVMDFRSFDRSRQFRIEIELLRVAAGSPEITMEELVKALAPRVLRATEPGWTAEHDRELLLAMANARRKGRLVVLKRIPEGEVQFHHGQHDWTTFLRDAKLLLNLTDVGRSALARWSS